MQVFDQTVLEIKISQAAFRLQLCEDYLLHAADDFLEIEQLYQSDKLPQVMELLIKLQGTASLVAGKQLEANIKQFKHSPNDVNFAQMKHSQMALIQAIEAYLLQQTQ
ncbi:hypothetical protein [Motilimonas pumila]|uniref:Uncharacterized protein n=1 Tax=Motilimonas pumila TaxID=2303987 RepID=A0A418YHZ6_9GAMM|nr:hypothetical protein [Motilimonas pumila]RJG49965.1 hypothetical protein D1Z90_04790 [Motilimonas pumila]